MKRQVKREKRSFQIFTILRSNIVRFSFRLQGSIDSQLDVISMHGSRLDSERKPSLTRSQTDSNITYASDEIPEAPGSCCYITKEGDIDLQVVLKVEFRLIILSRVFFMKLYFKLVFLYQAVHSVALRDSNCCTLRVCENILNLVELLIDMGVMKQCLRDEITGSIAGKAIYIYIFYYRIYYRMCNKKIYIYTVYDKIKKDINRYNSFPIGQYYY